jgi:NAD(P)H-dependent flavin oxidoreductase YrpB (nitropropane dioxygenase family)
VAGDPSVSRERKPTMLTTRFTELVGCTVPIQQAPIGGCATPRLAAAIAEAGGLGMVAVTGDPPEIVAAQLDQARRQTVGPIGANLFVSVADPAIVREGVAAAAERARVVDFFYADPDPTLVAIAHAGGALACWQVGSAEEARAAVGAGCDFVIAQGFGAGGHVRGRLGLLALLDAVLAAVDVPVLAAGGVGSGRAMAAALAAGADGVRVGTRFVAAEEAEAHPAYVAALIAAGPQDTAYGDTFALDHPGLPHRALRSSVEAVTAFQGEVVGERFRPPYGDRVPVHRFEKMVPTRYASGAIEAMPLWAGESVGGVTRVQPAAEIVHELANDAERLLRRWTSA